MNAATVAEPLHPPQERARPVAGAVKRATLILAALTVLAAALRFIRIGHQSFWYDEGFTALLVHDSPGKMLGQIPQTELTPPLYYCLAWVWARIFGYGEAALRSLSALAGVATIPAVYGAGAKLISRRAGLVAAALAAFNPFLIWYSQEARSYALLVLFATLSLLAFAYAREEPTPRRLAAWVLAAGLTLWTHYFGVLAIAPQAVWLLWVHRADRRVLLAVAAVAALGLALLPIALSQRPQANWIERWPLDRRLGQIAPQYVLGTGVPARTWLKLAGAAALLLAAAMLAWRADSSERRGALLAGALALSGLVICLILVAVGLDELITRNVLVLLVPMILLVAGGLGARRAGLLGLTGAATLCTIGLVAAIGVAVDWRLQRPDWRGVVRLVGATPPAGGGRAVLIQRYIFLQPLAFDMPGLRFLKQRGAKVNELDVIAMKVPPHGWFCWWGSACNLLASDLDTSIHIPGFRRVGPVLHHHQFSILRLRSSTPVRLTPQKVARALTKTALPNDGLLVQPPG